MDSNNINMQETINQVVLDEKTKNGTRIKHFMGVTSLIICFGIGFGLGIILAGLWNPFN